MIIYYFSGTGNSLVVAKDLAQKTGAQLIPIANLISNDIIEPKTDAFGLVFPVYYATNDDGVPLIINQFIGKLRKITGKYVFAICTHGGMPGSTIENLKKTIELQGGKLALGFNIKMTNKNQSAKKRKEQRIRRQKKTSQIAEYVNTQKTNIYETRGMIRKIILAPLKALEKPIFKRRYQNLSKTKSRKFTDLIHPADNSFQITNECNGCQTCAQVCPVKNIKIINNKPVWQHRCENCYACYSWCPQKAITGEIVKYNQQYNHPEIKLSDAILLNPKIKF